MRNRKYLLIAVLVVLLAALSLPAPALASGNGDGGTTGEALAVLENTFKDLGVLQGWLPAIPGTSSWVL
jgi:hypothetical protein